jgi:hypothetical protein
MVAVVLLFTILTVAFNYPISVAPDTYLTHFTDPRLVTWTLAWNAHAFATNPLHVFQPNIYFPDTSTKASSETFLLPSLLVAPVNWAGHPLAAYNLVLLSSFVLCGLGATLWVRDITGSLAAGILAGMIWAFAPGKFDQISHLHMMLGQWIPFALLYCGRYLESGRARDLYVMSLFAGVQFGFSMHYGVFLVPLLGLYAVGLLAVLPQSRLRANLAQMQRQLVIGAGVMVLLAAAVGIPYWMTTRQVDMRRDTREVLQLSGQPDSFLSPSMHNQAPHDVWLFERYHINDASYFVGLVPSILALFALLVLWPRALHAVRAGPGRPAGSARARDSTDSAGEERAVPASSPWRVARRRVHVAAVVVAAAGLLLHFIGLAAGWSQAGGWARTVVQISVTVHPALWAGVGVVVALITLATAPAGTPRATAYLAIVGYLAIAFYLLAYGPEVQAFGAVLGHGPYWLLYRFVLPFKIIRSAGRIGLLWILLAGALAGFGWARVERRWRGAPATRRVALALLLVVLVWEFRVWPMRHFVVDPAADPADTWLAEQPGDFAVVHAPIETGRDALQETAYMLGSTLHWKELVNGYLRYAPLPYRDLAQSPQLSEEFFRKLRAGFPVRYLLVHEDRLTDAQWVETRRLLARNDDAAFVTQLGYTLVFDVLGGDYPAPPPPEGAFGLEFRRPYTAQELATGSNVELAIRGAQTPPTDAVIALAGWGEDKQIVEVTDAWKQVSVPVPQQLGSPLPPFEVLGHTLAPVGETGERVMSGFTIEASRRGSAVGVGARVFNALRAPAILVHRLERYGNGELQRRRFEPTPEDAAEMLRYLEQLPPGELVAVSIVLEDFAPLPPDTVRALRLIGVEPPADETVLLVAVLGVSGAPPGSALQSFHHTRAFVDIQGPVPVLQVRDIALR